MNGLLGGARRHVISGAFVFLLLGVFAVFATLMVALGAQLYRDVVSDADAHNDRRILMSYVTNVVRGSDGADRICVETMDGVDVLTLRSGRFETRIYCYEGALREMFTAAGEPFVPEYGEVICAAAGFEPRLEGNLLEMTVTDAKGEAQSLHVALRTDQEGAQE